jgi:hypothetical protein
MCAAGFTEVFPDLFGLIDFDGAGMGLLLRDANLDKHVEDLFAFYFQLASQIVNSNLHPPFISLCPNVPLAQNGKAAPQRGAAT